MQLNSIIMMETSPQPGGDESTLSNPNITDEVGSRHNSTDAKASSLPPGDREWPNAPSRIAISPEELEEMDVTKLRELWREQDLYLEHLEARYRDQELKLRALQDPARRDQLLVMRLTSKEQEIQELSTQIAALKSSQVASTSQLKATLVDPAVNVIIQKLKVRLLPKYFLPCLNKYMENVLLQLLSNVIIFFFLCRNVVTNCSYKMFNIIESKIKILQLPISLYFTL